VSAIAFAAGFASIRRFNAAFRAVYRRPPSAEPGDGADRRDRIAPRSLTPGRARRMVRAQGDAVWVQYAKA